MIRPLHIGQPQVVALRMLQDRHGPRHRHVRIRRPVQQPHRERQRQRIAQHQPRAPVLDQVAGDDIGAVIVFGGQLHPPRRHQRRALAIIKARPHRIFGEIRGGGDAHEARDLLRHLPRDQQRDPSPHGRSHEDLRPLRQRPKDVARILRPVADRTILERTGTVAMPGIVEAEEGAAPRARPGLQRHGLCAAHVRAETAQEHDTGLVGPRALGHCAVIGEFPPLIRCEDLERRHEQLRSNP